MKGIRAKIENLFSEANGGKAKPLSKPDECMAAAEKVSQVLKTIQPALTHSHPTGHLSEFLRCQGEQAGNWPKAQHETLTTRKRLEGSRVADMRRTVASTTTIDLTGETDVTSTKSPFGSLSWGFKSVSKSLQDLFAPSAHRHAVEARSSKTSCSKAHSGRSFLSAKGKTYGQPMCIDDDVSVLLTKSRNSTSVPYNENGDPETDEEAERDARAEREMHGECAILDQNLAMKRQAARQNEVEARNKRLRFSRTSTDTLPRAKTAIQRGRTDEADVLAGTLATLESGRTKELECSEAETDFYAEQLSLQETDPDQYQGDVMEVIMGSGKAAQDRRHFGPGISNPSKLLRESSPVAPASEPDTTAPPVQVAESQENPEDQKEPAGGDLSQQSLDLALLQPWDIEVPEPPHASEVTFQGTSGDQVPLAVFVDSIQASSSSTKNSHATACSAVDTAEQSSTLNPVTLVDANWSGDLQTPNVNFNRPNDVDGGLSGNWHKPLLTSEESLIFPKTHHDDSDDGIPGDSPKPGDLQAHSGKGHSPMEDGGSSENPLPSSEESRFFQEIRRDCSGNSSQLHFSRTSPSSDLQANIAKVHDPSEDGVSFGNHLVSSEELLFFPTTRLDANSALPESVKGAGRDDQAATSPIAIGNQSAPDSSSDSEQAVGSLRAQDEKHHVQKNPQNHESKDCNTTVCESVEEFLKPGLSTPYAQARGNRDTPHHESCREDASSTPRSEQSQMPGANPRRRKMTTPERKEAKRRANKKCEEKKKAAWKFLKGETNLNPVDTFRRSSSDVSFALADRDRLRSTIPPLETLKDEGLESTPRQRRMTTPERKEAKRRAAQKHAAKKKLERMSLSGQNGLSASDSSRRPSSKIPYGSNDRESHGEERAQGHNLVLGRNLSNFNPEVVLANVESVFQNQRPVTARKGLAQKSTASVKTVEPDVVGSEEPEFDEMEEDDIESEIESTEEEMLFHYFVTRTEHRTYEADDEPMEVLYGPYHTLTEANTVASDVLLHFESANSFSTEHRAGWDSDANGLKKWHFDSDTTHVDVVVTREIKRKATLPKGSARIPPKVYEAYQRTTNAGNQNQLSHLHLGTFTLLDLANRHAAKTWVGVEMGELPDCRYTREVARPSKEREMMRVCEKLEETGGFFGKRMRVRGEGEVEVGVVEKVVVGPRN